jgi:hypothetical protein
MGDEDPQAAPPPIPPRAPSPPRRDGCLTAFMVLFGIVLLLPGLCAVVFGVGNLGSSHAEPVITMLVLLGLLVGAGGVFLIRAAIRGPRP